MKRPEIARPETAQAALLALGEEYANRGKVWDREPRARECYENRARALKLIASGAMRAPILSLANKHR